MKLKFILAATVAVAAVATLAACDSGSKPAETPAAATPAPSPPPPPPPPPPAPTSIPGMTAPYASEADWVAGCKDAKLPDSVCACVSKATVKELGAEALYTWVWEGYVNREGMATMRSRKWFEDKGIDKAKQQKFADAVGKCYVTK